MKVVINTHYGGFALSKKCLKLIEELSGKKPPSYLNIERHDPFLIEAIETLGADICAGPYSRLAIVEIPDDVDYVIEEYDGMELVAERHRTW
ncbi:MAG: hypothetical protein LBS45_04000 [Synergistaceae bacterium]|nr:hypothetical protein [Synergistaceae bacterium]